MNSRGPEPIRFAIILDGELIQRWQLRSIEQLLTDPAIEFAAIIVRPRLSPAQLAWLFRRIVDTGQNRGLREPVAIPDSLAYRNIPRLELTSEDQPATDAREAAGFAMSNLDFVLNFSTRTVSPRFVQSIRLGVWQFQWGKLHAADPSSNRGAAAPFWESYADGAIATARLVRLTTDANKLEVLREGCLRVANKSFRAVCDLIVDRFTHWPAQVCTDIRSGGGLALHCAALASNAGTCNPPGNAASILYAGKSILRRARSFADDLFRHDQWNVGVIKGPIESMLSGNVARSVEWLPALRRSEFLADCFGVIRENEMVLLCEYLNQSDGRGIIVTTGPGPGAARVQVDIGPTPPVHLSYPFLFECEGDILCIPETHEAREVALYAPIDFPRRWKKIATLLHDIEVVDATAFQHGGYWWLAASEVAAKGANCELHLWYAQELMGPWHPHAQNPVKTDVRSARPGGTPFVHRGALYRPAQDCSRTYGGSIVINRVTTLTPHCFREEIAAKVAPDSNGPYPDGLHTLSAVGPYTVLDAKRRVFVRQEFFRVLRWALRRSLGMTS